MKCYKNYNGEIPTGVEVIHEGNLTRIFFDYELIERTIDEETEQMLVCENVDVNGNSRDAIISAIINDRYSADKLDAVRANYELAKDAESGISDSKRAEYIAEYEAWQAWRAKAKQVASEIA